MQVKPKEEFKAVDFFCGAGGMSCGFSQAGVKILAGIDIEKQFHDTYLANHRDALFLVQDITRYEPRELMLDVGIKKFDDNLIFIGCSPCQYWSKINTSKRLSSYTSNLLADFQRFIKFFMPGHIVVENVPGIATKKNNHVLLDFYDFLTFHGYKYKSGIIQTDDYGVPQKRKRFILIASRIKEKVDLPRPDGNSKEMIVRNFIGVKNGFPSIPDGFRDDSNRMHWTSKLSPLNKERVKNTPKNGGSRMTWKDDPKLQVPTYKNCDNSFRSGYGRLSWDHPSPTITTRFIATSCGRFSHPEEDRGLSLREGATLQTFPIDYKFIGGMVSVAKQIGNAVPPEMAKRIAKSIIGN